MNTAIILSGGSGARFGGDIPKQYVKVKGRMLIEYSIDAMKKSNLIDSLVVVSSKEWEDDIENAIKDIDFIGFAKPGETRQLSILSGLRLIHNTEEKQKNKTDYVLIHDAARPNITSEMIDTYINAAKGHDGLMPVLPMKDTIYLSEDKRSITGLLDRNRVFAGQAPEVYKLKKYLKANEDLLPERIKTINGSTEPAFLAKMDIVLFPGDESNYKITTKEDLKRFETER